MRFFILEEKAKSETSEQIELHEKTRDGLAHFVLQHTKKY